AAIQALSDAIEAKKVPQIVSMALVEGFVMFFEVMFLYRELIDAITPWIAQQTGFQLGFFTTLGLASFGWIGVRAMTWFLFGRSGTWTRCSRAPRSSARAASTWCRGASHDVAASLPGRTARGGRDGRGGRRGRSGPGAAGARQARELDPHRRDRRERVVQGSIRRRHRIRVVLHLRAPARPGRPADPHRAVRDLDRRRAPRRAESVPPDRRLRQT